MIGDANDIYGRLKATLPGGWFGDINPVLDTVLYGVASAFAFIYALYAYAKLQTRIATATDDWLDVIAYDFYGGSLTRNAGEMGSAFRVRIIANLWLSRVTRPVIFAALRNLTGYPPRIIEPQRPADTLGLSEPNFGYSTTGYYGSVLQHHQALITVYGWSGPAQTVYDLINSLRPIGTKVWVCISPNPPPIYAQLGAFVLNQNALA